MRSAAEYASIRRLSVDEGQHVAFDAAEREAAALRRAHDLEIARVEPQLRAIRVHEGIDLARHVHRAEQVQELVRERSALDDARGQTHRQATAQQLGEAELPGARLRGHGPRREAGENAVGRRRLGALREGRVHGFEPRSIERTERLRAQRNRQEAHAERAVERVRGREQRGAELELPARLGGQRFIDGDVHGDGAPVAPTRVERGKPGERCRRGAGIRVREPQHLLEQRCRIGVAAGASERLGGGDERRRVVRMSGSALERLLGRARGPRRRRARQLGEQRVRRRPRRIQLERTFDVASRCARIPARERPARLADERGDAIIGAGREQARARRKHGECGAAPQSRPWNAAASNAVCCSLWMRTEPTAGDALSRRPA